MAIVSVCWSEKVLLSLKIQVDRPLCQIIGDFPQPLQRSCAHGGRGHILPRNLKLEIIDPHLPFATNENTKDDLCRICGHINDQFVFVPVSRTTDWHMIET